MTDLDWMTRGACTPSDGELFATPEKRPVHQDDATTAAKQICGRCPVQDRCLQHALTNGITDGIWGGLAPWERRRLPTRHAALQGCRVVGCDQPARKRDMCRAHYERWYRTGTPTVPAASAVPAAGGWPPRATIATRTSRG